MNSVLGVALAAMRQDMARVDMVAGNLANVSTPAYKRAVMASIPFAEAMESAAFAADPALASNATAGAPLTSTLVDNRPGTLKRTGEPLDIALTGEGFFEVATSDGPAYTRRGTFKVDARGHLLDVQGHPVMGKNGEIFLSTANPSIDASGVITEPEAAAGSSAAPPGSPIAQLKVVTFDVASATRLGGGLVRAGTGMKVLDDGDVRLRQGSLENSNVENVQEMTQLIQAMRHFESMQRVVQGYDEMVGAAVRKLGDLS